MMQDLQKCIVAQFMLVWNLTVYFCIHIDPLLSSLNLLYTFTPYSLLPVSRFLRDLFC